MAADAGYRALTGPESLQTPLFRLHLDTAGPLHRHLRLRLAIAAGGADAVELRLEAAEALPDPTGAGESAGRIRIHRHGGQIQLRAPGLAALIDPAVRLARYRLEPAFDTLPAKEQGDLLLLPLLHLLRTRGISALHAAAVLSPAGAVLLAGESGRGKSTTAASLDAAGWPLLADDVLLLSSSGPPAVAAALRGAAYRADSAALLGYGAGLGVDGKHFHADAGRAGLQRLALLAFPRRVAGASRIERLSPAAALLRLLPAVGGLVADGVHAADQLARLRGLAAAVPAVELGLGEGSFGRGGPLAALLRPCLERAP